MSEILSQNEIDELLAALAAGNDATQAAEADASGEGEVRPYNFRTANKFSKEQIRMLHFIYENFAGRLGTALSGTLRVMCDAEVVSVEEQTFGEYNNSLPSPAFLSIFQMPPLAGSCLMELSSSVSYEIISRLFGGKGQQFEPEINKTFTEIEIAILNRIVQQMLSVMDESWGRIITTRTLLERTETSSQFAQIVASSEPIVIITMNLKVGQMSDIINICLPHVAIQPIAKQLAAATWYNERSSMLDGEDVNSLQINPRINTTLVTLSARFSDTEATVQDVISMQEGDVIRVDHPVSQDLVVMVEHMPKFRGKIGIQGKRMAVRVTEILKEVTEDG